MEEALKSLESRVAKCNTTLLKISEVGDKLEKAGTSITNVGKKVSVASATVAARSLKGITVEIDGSTTGLQSTLREVDIEIKKYTVSVKGRGKTPETGPIQYGTAGTEAEVPDGCHQGNKGKAGHVKNSGGVHQ